MSINQQLRKSKLALGICALAAAGLCYFGTTRYVKPVWLGYQFEQNLQKEPLFQVVAKEHPQAYAEFTQKVKADLKNPGDPNIITQASATLVNAVFFQYVDKAPDDALFHYLNSTLALYRYLAQANPTVIVKLENPQYPGNIEMGDLGTNPTFLELFAKLLNAKQQIIVLGINHPIDPPKSTLSRQQLLLPVFEDLSKKYPPEALAKMMGPGQMTVPPAELAQFIIDFYTAITNEGPEKSAMILRSLGKQT